jgi:hypothetical protein
MDKSAKTFFLDLDKLIRLERSHRSEIKNGTRELY